MKAYIAIPIALSCYLGAAYADAAKADPGNPYHPVPAASSETPDHGRGTYCSKVPVIGTCEIIISSRNGLGEVRVSITPEAKPAPAKSPECDHGPKI